MKKLFVCMTLVLSMSACATAFAAENYVDYNYDETNSVTNPANGYKTVLITKDSEAGVTSDSIVYVDQSESGFDTAAKFLLKENPAPGYYTATFGSDDMTISSKSYSFVIGNGDDAIIQSADKMEVIEENDNSYIYTNGNVTTYKKAFKLITKADRYNDYKSVKLVYNNKTDDSSKQYTVMGALPKEAVFDNNTTTTGEGNVGIVLQFHGMEENQFKSAEQWDVYFSADEVSKLTKTTEQQ